MPEKTIEIYKAVKTKKHLRVWFSGAYRPIFRDIPCHDLVLPEIRGMEGRTRIDYEIVELPDGTLPMEFDTDEKIEGIDR